MSDARAAPPRTAEPKDRLVERIFVEALEHDSAGRSSFVEEQCGGDEWLRDAVSSLLVLHEQTGLLDRLPVDLQTLSNPLQEREGEVEGLPEARFDPGASLGRYEIRERLGAGGMGEVFRAFDPRLRREVAIKVIARRIEDHDHALARFEREAHAASALNHPNIVTVHDIGEQDGFPYIVMELVEGKSLRDTSGEALPLDRLLPLARQLAAGLAAAHDAGVVHRDLKPANIVVDPRGTPRILDFGLARFGPLSTEGQKTLTVDQHLPAVSGLIGTIGYMSPEAIRGAEIDARADQFALGATLYEMATGRRAFVRSTIGESLLATLHEDPTPVADCNPDLPLALVEVIHRCLEKEPGHRFDNTGEIHRVLSSIRVTATTGRISSEALPVPTTRLIGRDAELAEIQDLLLSGEAHLLTLTGVGGSGKTRLAIETARELRGHFSAGVWFVPLAAIGDPELVLPAVVAAIGGVPAAGRQDLEQLQVTLAADEAPALLVLDNFEQVIEAAPAIGALVAACPRLSVLVTSREALHLSAEHGFAVRPLALPPTEGLSVDQLVEVPSVALFVERAQAADPDFELNAANAQAVADLCQRFDGLPLALELAAARVRLMSPEAMLKRLGDRLDLLTGGARDLPDRQRTLRAAMDWSYDLLRPTEQTVFRRLAVFVDGFALDATEAVVDPFGRLPRAVVEVLESLLNQSLLTRESTSSGDPRFSMLQTVREYAFVKMREEENVGALQEAHAAYFLVLAEEADAVLSHEENPTWFERVQSEQGNFRAALDWTVDHDRGEWGLRMARGLYQVWHRGDGIAEGQRYMAKLLALPSTQGVTELRAEALFRAGTLVHQSDSEADLNYQRQALELYRRLGNLWGQAVALNAAGISYTDLGKYEDATHCYEQCMDLWKQLGESSSVAAALSNFAYVLRKQGNHKRSKQIYRDAAAMCERLGDRAGAAWKLSHEADVVRDEGDEAAARSLYHDALATFRELDEPWGVGSVLVELAEIAYQEAEFASSAEKYREALAIFNQLGHARGVALVLEGLAQLAASRSEDARVLELAGAASALRERAGGSTAERPERVKAQQHALVQARHRLGDVAAAETHWRRGRNTPLERLVSELLEPDQA